MSTKSQTTKQELLFAVIETRTAVLQHSPKYRFPWHLVGGRFDRPPIGAQANPAG